jgi:hypothetical protein
MTVSPGQPRRRLSLVGAASALGGLVLFALTLYETGLAPVSDGIRRIGTGFAAVLVLAGLRFLVRAWAWVLCTDSAAGRLTLADTMPALLAGDALGNLTPLGLFASEPAKAAFVRHRVSLLHALAGVALENLFYTFSVAVVIAAGTASLLFLFDVPPVLRQASLLALAMVVAVVVAGTVMLAWQIKVVSGTVSWLERRRLGPAWLHDRLEKVRTLEDTIYGFAGRHAGRLPSILALETMFHVLGVAEVWFVLWLLVDSSAVTWLSTFVLESVNRTITVVFKFVPLRLGVDEVGTELLTRTLGLPVGLGVTMAIVRKARMLFWAGVGVAILVRRGFTKARSL